MLKRVRRPKLITDPVESARSAGLRYVEPGTPGFLRRRAGRGFCYVDAQGKPIRDPAHLKRIRSLVIPPAWTRVWICASPEGHLQAVGYDARGRRQYRYHPQYRAVRDETKFARMTQFAEWLPRIRQRVNQDLAKPGLTRERVLASVVRLLETTFIRVGNVEYAKENDSFGLTTLRNRHVDIDGSTIRFRFKGKSGVVHNVEIKDRRIAHIVQACQDLPGYNLFEYLDDSGDVRTVTSEDINAYIKEITGEGFTAKDFRTWAGTVQTALALASLGAFESETEAKRNIVSAIKDTARRLGNRPATCRKYYVHPAIVDAYMDRSLLDVVKAPDPSGPASGTVNPDALYPEELCVVKLIERYSAPKRMVA